MGGSAELSEFIRREHPRLVGALTLHCGDRVLAEDLAQEALARTCVRWSQVRLMTSPRAWVYRVALNLSASWFRRRAAELRANARHGLSGGPLEDPDVAQALAVRAAVAALPDKQRTALVCRHYLALSVPETAELMGCSEDAVRQNVARGSQALRRRLTSAPPGRETRHVR